MPSEDSAAIEAAFENIINRLSRIEGKADDLIRRNPGYMDTAGAANFLGLSRQTLEVWRHQSQGPRYYKVSRVVRYAITDLIAFMETHGVASLEDD